jgi:hypothetical protein
VPELSPFAVPVAVSDTGFEMPEGMSLVIDPRDLMANDGVPDESDVVFPGPTGPGVTALWDGTCRADAPCGFFGTPTLRHALTVATAVEVPTTVEIEALPVGDAPLAGHALIEPEGGRRACRS